MSKNTMKTLSLGLLILGCVLATANPVAAEFIQKSSADFDWKYEMNVEPINEDLDENSVMDFSLYSKTGGSASITDGILTLDTASNRDYIYRYATTDASQPWNLDSTISYANGYTMEICVQVTSSGYRGLPIFALTDSSGNAGWLNITASGQTWGYEASTNLGSNDNTDGYHVFRIAKAPGESTFSVWRDGVLLTDSIAGDVSSLSAISDRISIGDIGNQWQGSFNIDYVRYTGGAFAPVPVPEPSTLALLAAGLVGLLAYAWKKRK